MFLKIRRLGAASITPWNINWYCMEPLPEAAVESVDPELTVGGAPVRRIGPRALTLNYGYLPDQPAWKPNPAYDALKACYTRQRFYLVQRPRQAFSGAQISLALEVWNDTNESLRRALSLVAEPWSCSGRRGDRPRLTRMVIKTSRRRMSLAVPQVRRPEALQARMELVRADGQQVQR